MTHTPVQLSYESAQTLLRRAVMEKGADHRFEPEVPDEADSYYYFHPDTGQPGCIVGHVLAYRGITPEDLADANSGTGFGSLLRATKVVACDPLARTLLITAQDEQDAGYTWGEAVKIAVDYAELKRDEVLSAS